MALTKAERDEAERELRETVEKVKAMHAEHPTVIAELTTRANRQVLTEMGVMEDLQRRDEMKQQIETLGTLVEELEAHIIGKVSGKLEHTSENDRHRFHYFNGRSEEDFGGYPEDIRNVMTSYRNKLLEQYKNELPTIKTLCELDEWADKMKLKLRYARSYQDLDKTRADIDAYLAAFAVDTTPKSTRQHRKIKPEKV